MTKGFWRTLYGEGRPVVGLSPMDGVTDAAMRYMTAKYGSSYSSIPVNPYSQNQIKRESGFTDSQIDGGVDVLFTEFVSVDALHYARAERRERLLKTFIRARDIAELSSDQQPQAGTVTQLHSDTAAAPRRWPYEVAQVFGNKPAFFVEAAKLIESLGFDGIDINMGCPAHKVEENGSGAGLIRTPALAQEIILATKAATKLPVSVKTRIGVEEEVVEEWMETLCQVKPANISLHGRTLRQLYQGSADWEAIGRAAAVVHSHGGKILGNGDIQSLAEGMEKVRQYQVDGFLIGRAAEGNPGIFLQGQQTQAGTEPCRDTRLSWMVEHAKKFEEVFKYSGSPVLQFSSRSQENGKTGKPDNDNRWFMPVRKHLAWYCRGFPGAVEVRSKLMMTNSSSEVEKVIRDCV